MKTREIAIEALSNVVGGSLTGATCRAGLTALGAGAGAIIGFQGAANPAGALATGAAGVMNAANAGSDRAAVGETLAAGAAMIPGPVGAIAGAYTHGRNWNNFASQVVCPK